MTEKELEKGRKRYRTLLLEKHKLLTNYPGRKVLPDETLAKIAFNETTIKTDEPSNLFMYMASYIDMYTLTSRDDEKATLSLYFNIENRVAKLIPIEERKNFERENFVIFPQNPSLIENGLGSALKDFEKVRDYYIRELAICEEDIIIRRLYLDVKKLVYKKNLREQ